MEISGLFCACVKLSADNKIAKTTALNYIRPIRERVDEYNMQVNDELLNVKIYITTKKESK